MKKWSILLSTLLIMSFALTACSNSGSSSAQSANQNTKAGSVSKQQNPKQNSKQGQNQQQAQQKAQQEMQKQIKKGLLDDGETVAVVNGSKITGKNYNLVYQSVAQQLYTMAQQQGQSSNSDIAKQQTLNSLIGQTLILQNAKAKGYTASSDKIKTQYDQLAKQYGGQKKLKSMLNSQHMTVDDLKKNISQQIIFTEYENKEIGKPKVTDKEIQQYYDQYSKSQKNAPKLSAVKSQIKQQLEQQKQSQAVASVVDKLKKDATVDIKI